MSNLPKIYGFCDTGCRFEVPHKEELNLIRSTVLTINDVDLKFFVGKQEDYNKLPAEAKENLLAVITDDSTISGINGEIDGIKQRLDALGFKEGTITLSSNAGSAEYNVLCKQGNYVIGTYSVSITGGGNVIGTVPADFRPTTTRTTYGLALGYRLDLNGAVVGAEAWIEILPDGNIQYTCNDMNMDVQAIRVSIGYDTKA